MKMVIKYSEFRNDLLNLYCKVNKSSLENLYIKFAQDYDQSFFTWLRKNNSVANNLNNPSVYGALLTLLFLIITPSLRKRKIFFSTPPRPL